MTPTDRYDTSGLPEDQYQPGSDGKVLKNFLNIISREEMETVETAELWRAQEKLLEEVDQDQQRCGQGWTGITGKWNVSLPMLLIVPADDPV